MEIYIVQKVMRDGAMITKKAFKSKRKAKKYMKTLKVSPYEAVFIRESTLEL